MEIDNKSIGKIILMFAVFFLACLAVGYAYQPVYGYELDESEIRHYISELKAEIREHKAEIEKFEYIQKNNIYDYEEYKREIFYDEMNKRNEEMNDEILDKRGGE